MCLIHSWIYGGSKAHLTHTEWDKNYGVKQSLLLQGVVKGIPLELREDSFVWPQDCCDLRCGRLDDTLFIGYVSSWK